PSTKTKEEGKGSVDRFFQVTEYLKLPQRGMVVFSRAEGLEGRTLTDGQNNREWTTVSHAWSCEGSEHPTD
ncbi:hypothetical protein Hamer_G030616, partial [Homarus americanus]